MVRKIIETCRYCGNSRNECGCPRFRTNQVKSAEWVQPIRRGYEMECCDCGLVHILNFRLRRGRVQFQAFRKEVKNG